MGKMEWKSFKPVQGYCLAGIWSNQLVVNQRGNEWDYSFGDLILNIKKDFKTDESWYWRLFGSENEEGDDLLIIEEQETPEPLEYFYEPELSKQPMIIGSKISLDHSLIKKVSGYGFKDGDYEILTTLIFALEKLYVTFKISGPIVTANISETEIEKFGDLFFLLELP